MNFNFDVNWINPASPKHSSDALAARTGGANLLDASGEQWVDRGLFAIVGALAVVGFYSWKMGARDQRVSAEIAGSSGEHARGMKHARDLYMGFEE